MTTLVADFYSAHGADFYQCLKANGISGVARYLTNSETDQRQLTPQELQFAHDAGLEVFFVYEMNPVYAGYFTANQGRIDALAAMDRLNWLGAPEGVVCYFAVDAPAGTIPPSVLDEYFNGVESVCGTRFKPGVYGYAAHVEYARSNFPNTGKHLWQTYGTPQGPLDMWQHEQKTLCGVEVDINDATVSGWGNQKEGANDMTDEQVKAIIRLMFTSPEGKELTKFAIAGEGGYGRGLETELEALRTQVRGAIEFINQPHAHPADGTSPTVPPHIHKVNGVTDTSS